MKLGLNVSSNLYHDNYSLAINGSTQYINADTVAGDINKLKGTFSAWARIDGTMSANGRVIMASTDSSNQMYIQYHNAAEEWRFLYLAGGVSKQAVRATDAESDGLWYHLAMTWDIAEDDLKGYVNGTLVQTKTGLGTWSGTIDECYLGSNTLASSQYLKGNINEVSIFDDVADVSLLYNGGNPVDISNMSDLIGYWKLDEGSGTDAADASGLANKGSLVNTPTWKTDIKL